MIRSLLIIGGCLALTLLMSLSDCEPEKLSQACVESIQYASDLSTNGLISTIRAASNRGSRDTLMVLYPALRKYWNQEIGSAEADVLNSWPDQPVKKEVAPRISPSRMLPLMETIRVDYLFKFLRAIHLDRTTIQLTTMTPIVRFPIINF